MLRIYLIRHGQSENNAEPDFEKHQFDPPLTKLGVLQSQALGGHLKNGSDNGALRYGYRVDKIYTSPQLRALQTTAEIVKFMDIRPEIHARIYERGGVVLMTHRGIYHDKGLTRTQITKQFPTYKIPYQVTVNGWWKGTENKVESNDDVIVRARVVANDLFIKARSSNDTGVVFVSHGTFVNFLMQVLLNDHNNKYLHKNAAISRIDIDRNTKATLKFLNYTDHLDQTWIT